MSNSVFLQAENSNDDNSESDRESDQLDEAPIENSEENSNLNNIEYIFLEIESDDSTTVKWDNKPGVAPDIFTNSGFSDDDSEMPYLNEHSTYSQNSTVDFSLKLNKGEQLPADSINVASNPGTSTNTIYLKNKPPIFFGKDEHFHKQIKIVSDGGKAEILKPFFTSENRSPTPKKADDEGQSSNVPIFDKNFRRIGSEIIPEIIDTYTYYTVSPETENNKTDKLSIIKEEYRKEVDWRQPDTNSSRQNFSVNKQYFSGKNKYFHKRTKLVSEEGKVTHCILKIRKALPKSEVQSLVQAENASSGRSVESSANMSTKAQTQGIATLKKSTLCQVLRIVSTPKSELEGRSKLLPMPKIPSHKPTSKATTFSLPGNSPILPLVSPVQKEPKQSSKGEMKIFTNLDIADDEVPSSTVTLSNNNFGRIGSEFIPDANSPVENSAEYYPQLSINLRKKIIESRKKSQHNVGKDLNVQINTLDDYQPEANEQELLMLDDSEVEIKAEGPITKSSEFKIFTNLDIADDEVPSSTVTVSNNNIRKIGSEFIPDSNSPVENSHVKEQTEYYQQLSFLRKEDLDAKINILEDFQPEAKEQDKPMLGDSEVEIKTGGPIIEPSKEQVKCPKKSSKGEFKILMNLDIAENEVPSSTVMVSNNNIRKIGSEFIPDTNLHVKEQTEYYQQLSILRKEDLDAKINILDDFQREANEQEKPMLGDSEVEIKTGGPIIEPLKEQVKDELPLAIQSDLDATSSEKPPTLDPKAFLGLDSLDFSTTECLIWKDGIGSVPGIDVKLFFNEFGILECLDNTKYQKILRKQQRRAKREKKMERLLQCVKCQCYGIRADFADKHFCSLECQDAAAGKKLKPSKASRVKRKNQKQESDPDSCAEDESFEDTLQKKFTYPWECEEKGFVWSKYLLCTNAKRAPAKLFNDASLHTQNQFKIGMKLEGVDPEHPSYFCVLTVKDVVGYRICMHFDGYSSNYDFWINADSPNIFPIGWCKRNNHKLWPPPSFSENNFNWIHYLKVTKGIHPPQDTFIHRGKGISPSSFRIGMKLEAIDKKDLSIICVATVRDKMDERILVHFDGRDDIYDYWADATSPYIHPVGWSAQNGHDLTTPSNYPGNFTWKKYLEETEAVAAPARAFRQRPACGFKIGMRLECVDKRAPHLIRVAKVDDVTDHQIRILFDGWPDKYSYWLDADSPDIHPPGWSQRTGHPIEPPLTPRDVYGFPECPTVCCRGQGHSEGLKYRSHSSRQFCPYADENIDKILPDRLLNPDEEEEFCSKRRKNNRKPRMAKFLKRQKASKQENDDYHEPTTKKRKTRNSNKLTIENEDNKQPKALVMDPAKLESIETHSAFLRELIPTDENPFDWSIDDVCKFVSSIPECETDIALFRRHGIDGEAFVHLNMSDLKCYFNIKLGSAIKLYGSILMLRQQYSEREKGIP